MEEKAERFRRGRRKSGLSCCRSVAEAFFLHLFGGGGETLRTSFFHREKTECLGQRDAIGASLQKFYLRRDFPVDGVHGNLAHGSVRNGAFGQDSRPSGEREALQNADKAHVIDGKKGALAVRDADAWRP